MSLRVGLAMLLLALETPACSSVKYSAAAEQYRVSTLPGLNQSMAAQFTQFAGLLNIGTAAAPRELFFWFFESERDPDTDPLVLWTNGGPGCSSLLGLLSENGPFRPTAGGDLDLDPFRWTQRASMLFVEQPVFVGYSRSAVEGDAASSDAENAEDLAEFVERFLVLMGGFANHSLYLSGESFAGHYLPATAEQLLHVNHRRRAANATALNFRGFLVGNPFTNPAESNKGVVGALYGHSMLPKAEYDKWRRRCAWGDSIEGSCYWEPWWLFDRFVGEAVNPYALTYPLCHPEASAAHKQRYRLLDVLLQRDGLAPATGDDADATAPLSSSRLELLYEPCREDYLTAWLNQQHVRRALNVDHNLTWEMCSDPVWYNYSVPDFDRDMVPTYKRLLWRNASTPALAEGEEPLKILVFSGDDDCVCGTHGTQSWVYQLGINVTSYWEPWFFMDPVYGEQIGGYYSELAGMHFATVHGAGHEVPAYKPAAALQLLDNFLALNSTGGTPVAGPKLLSSDADACGNPDNATASTDDGAAGSHHHHPVESVGKSNAVAFVAGGTMLVLGMVLGGLGTQLWRVWLERRVVRDFRKLQTEVHHDGEPGGADSADSGMGGGGISGTVLSALYGGGRMAVHTTRPSPRGSVSMEMV